jgi:hypothetical protein
MKLGLKMAIDYFPLGTASGSTFCNRKKETTHLLQNITSCRPTLIMSPRRYGKTSLVFHCLKKSKVIYGDVDFYKELTGQDIQKNILNGIGKILSAIESRPKQLLNLASEFFSHLQVKLGYKDLELAIETNVTSQSPATVIQKALEKLHAFTEKKNIQVVFFIDEFQRLSEITSDISIEGAIRHMAQLPSNICYIFAGSNRHLIQEMFYDSKRPFYRLCDTIRLERISKEHYIPYIQKAAQCKWQRELTLSAIDEILSVTELHPYYINLLCSRLWLGDLPDIDNIIQAWETCAIELRPQIERELDLLTANQRKLLISFAKYGATNKPFSTEYMSKINMAAASTKQALAKLLEMDYVYEDQNGYYQMLDPAFKQILA